MSLSSSITDKFSNRYFFARFLPVGVNANSVLKFQSEIDSVKKELIQDREELKNVLVILTQLSTTLNTLKWIIVVFISAFGGIVVFLFQELVKLI